MRRFILSLFAGAAVVLSIVAASSASAAPGQLKITKISMDAVGADSWWNRNAEYIEITNVGDEPLNITSLKTEDGWAHGTNDSDSLCNTLTLTASNTDSSLHVDGQLVLPAGNVLRVYTGAGTPNSNGTLHTAYMNNGVSPRSGCGYRGHYLTNNADTVYVTVGTTVISQGYNWHGTNYMSF